MPFLVNNTISRTALRTLELFGDVIPFMTQGVTYPAISGHPDIFFCLAGDVLIASEAVPGPILRQLGDAGVHLALSSGRPADRYPGSAIFNAVATGQYLVHRSDITDVSIQDACAGMTAIHVHQAYTRCNLFVPDERLWVTSDAGICKALQSHGLRTVSIDPSPVRLPGFRNGFFGGCCGVFRDKVLINGSLKHLGEGQLLAKEFQLAGYQVIELNGGPLIDIGGILFV